TTGGTTTEPDGVGAGYDRAGCRQGAIQGTVHVQFESGAVIGHRHVVPSVGLQHGGAVDHGLSGGQPGDGAEITGAGNGLVITDGEDVLAVGAFTVFADHVLGPG